MAMQTHIQLLEDLTKLPSENEWVEFKLNYKGPIDGPTEIGERISALSNGACLHHQPFGYLVYGVKDISHEVEGTSFKPFLEKKGNEELEAWLSRIISPRIDFRIHEFTYSGLPVVLFEIPAAVNQPVEFSGEAYVRIGSTTKKLKEYPDKARKIWENNPQKQFERLIALSDIQPADIIRLLDTQCYFELMKQPYPSTQDLVIEKLLSDRLIVKNYSNLAITNLGALLFAKNLNEFPTLVRKAFRVTVYEGRNKLSTLKDITGSKGYAAGFKGLVSYVNDQLPQNEVISKALRKVVRMYPQDAIRELVANAMIHQDFFEKGGPAVEVYSDRIEISNPGNPSIKPMRFIDEYYSRNEAIADLMRRMGICEEKGSGIDRVIHGAEVYQLPAPDFILNDFRTTAFLYAHKAFNEMTKADRIRACYQHCCLKYVSNEKMTNQTLRERFKIDEKNAAIASRIIKETLEEKLIKSDDPESNSRKYIKYIPFWA